MKDYLNKLVSGIHLTTLETQSVMEMIMSGKATEIQVAGLITALRAKGETAEEITGAAAMMRQKSVRINANATTILDTCGTGGDALNTFNISTAAAFVAASAGICVAKHGNRSVTSQCGSADVLQALGANIEIDHSMVEEALQTIGIGFLFAQKLHPAMKYAAKPRKELGIRTVFNMLGPLTNPAGATCQLIGVYAPELTDLFVEVLKNLGTRRAVAVHGQDGLDEASVSGDTKVSELKDGVIQSYVLHTCDYFEDYASAKDVAGGTPEENAEIIKSIYSGRPGAPRNIVLLNSALALYVAGKTTTIKEGLDLAASLIDTGKAQEKLTEYISFTNS